jgi:hypothetical protein
MLQCMPVQGEQPCFCLHVALSSSIIAPWCFSNPVARASLPRCFLQLSTLLHPNVHNCNSLFCSAVVLSCSWLAATSCNVQLHPCPHAVWYHQAAQRHSSSSMAQLHWQQHKTSLVGREMWQQRLPDPVERRICIQCRNGRCVAKLCTNAAESGNAVE